MNQLTCLLALCPLYLTSEIVCAQESKTSPPFLATGVRVGEVFEDRAVVWVRLTAGAARNREGKSGSDASREGKGTGGKNPEKEGGKRSPEERRRGKLELPEGWRPEELVGACPGAAGAARVVFRTAIDPDGAAATPWQEARQENDFVVQFSLEKLRPGSRYQYRVETRSPSGQGGLSFEGSFRTADRRDSEEEVTFTVVTGMMYRDLDHRDGFHIYPAMASLRPRFMVATGDTVYYDSEWPRARSAGLARYHWHRMYSLPRLVEFHRRVPGYWIKDDHDTLDDDCWPGKTSGRVAPLTFEMGQRIFLEQVPMGRRTYRTARWGRHLQVWFVEGRDFRSPNTQEDGPGKTIWGEEQKRWLKKSLLSSDATFRVLVSATPIVGPDRPKGKNDNHSNRAFRHEGEGFRSWAREHLPERFYVVCGDRHWQYHSVDPRTGVQEFSCGSASDKHAGGTPGFDPRYHRFHRVKGGFLSVTAGKEGDRPFVAFRFHDVHGQVVYEHRETVFEKSELRVLAGEEGAAPPGRVLYGRLLAEARDRLAQRSGEVDALTDPEGIARRSEYIQKSILDSFGGFPERTDLNPRVVGRVERDDHVMEKVIYESRPGFHVTANLYLPAKGAPPYPAILFPCGHSRNGKAGSTYQTAGQEYARRGFAVFVYDPIGQGERFQFLDENGKPVVGGTTEHTFTGTAALLVGSNTAEVIIWDGIRAVDYLAGREDIDLERLGATGNSGGGTQTSYLMALEPRIRAAAPSCYLTTFGRLLETIGPQDAEQNFTGFIARRLDHADFLHAFAPRPALICAASGDFFDIGGTWTTFREAKRTYGRLGLAENVDLVEVDGRHGYHVAIRQRVGRFFERALMGRAGHEIVREVKEGTVYPDSELQCTPTGQVISSMKGRNVADLWREDEKLLRTERQRLYRETSREEWLRGVRRLAGMKDEVRAPRVQSRGETVAAGAVIEKLSWDEGFPVTALLFRPFGRAADSGGDHAGKVTQKGDTGTGAGPVEVIVASAGRDSLATRLAARARVGETILAVDLPGYGETTPEASRSHWGADWKAAFLAFHLERSLAGIRADALRQAIAHARALAGGGAVRVTGIGRAGLPALLAAAMEPQVESLRLEEALDSYAAIVEDGLHSGRLGNTIPRALAHFDLPLLREAMAPRKVEHVRPVGPRGEHLERWEF